MRLRTGLLLVVLCSLFASSVATEVAHAAGLTPWDVARIRHVSHAEVSPDGRYVAFTVAVPRDPMVDENGRDWAELHVFDRETSRQIPFITGEVNVSKLQWTPDGAFIAYLAKRHGDEKTALYVIPVAGGESRRLLAHEESIAEYAFSPNGDRLAFLAKEPEAKEIKDRKKMGFDAEPYEEYARSNQLFIAKLPAAAQWGVAELEPNLLDVDGHATQMHWSPTRDELLVTLAPTSRIDHRYFARQYCVISAASGEVLGRAETTGKLGAAAWAPDGERFAFVGPADQHDPKEGRLFVCGRNGGAPVEVLPNFPGHVAKVGWFDDSHVAFLADHGVQTFVGRVSARGGDYSVVVPEGEPVGEEFSLSADGKVMAMVADSPSYPAELFVGRVGRGLSRVTTSNPWLSSVELADQSVIEYEARDGVKVQGILMAPVGYQHGRRYPLIVVVHGGPEAHERNDWRTSYSRPGQYAAAAGYAVFYPNYRGSTGRGLEYSLLSQGDPAGKEFDDIVDGVDHLIETGLVDGDRVGITGGSYGGFATAWGATYYSDRYAAAVMFVGISEQFSKFGTTDIPRESQLVHQHPHKTYEDWDFFLERSPIYHAKGSKTPLLILHGKDDPRVHPTQSMIMYRYFQDMADAPVRLVWYPGEEHGNRKAAGKLDYSLRFLRWMDHFLQDGGTELPDFEISHEEPSGGGAR